MLKNSFVLLDRFGFAKEKALWRSGVSDWQAFLEKGKVPLVSAKSKAYYDRQVINAKNSLLSRDSGFFARSLPPSEHWRAYEEFCDEAVFLDIETSSFGRFPNVTLVGLSDGYEMKSMVRGINLDFSKLEKVLAKSKMIVTFNGSSFDLPVLRRFMRVPTCLHFDLRFACKRLGLIGGLKSIESRLGISRREQVASLHGGDAVGLWRMYAATGDEYYLNLLVEYNEEDVMNLRKLAVHCYSELRKMVFAS